jgi:hypothetical protein
MPMTIATTNGSITSRLVVGHVDLAFRDHGAKAICPPQDATHRRKAPVEKDKHDVSRLWMNELRSNATPLELCKFDIVSTRNNI